MDNGERARLGPFFAQWYPLLVVAALAVALWLTWGFTVDDALIPARYAHHLHAGLGYRFNPSGPVTDGVTPLGWAVLLSPAGGEGALGAFLLARVLGLVSVVLAVGWVAALVAGRARQTGRRWVYAAGVATCTSAPLAAWAGAGLETGVVAGLATLGVLLRERGRHRSGALVMGVAAALRPELLPWALVLSFARGPGVAPRRIASLDLATFARLGVACAPFLAVALTRVAVFGRAAPLSVYAKAPDLSLGAHYALACFLLTGPVALAVPLAWRRLDAWPRWLIVSVAVHFGAVAAAGGDWMPLSRLVVPILPTVALALSYVAAVVSPWSMAARVTLVLLGNLFVWAQVGLRAARVEDDRMALIEEMRPILRGSSVVASVDAGWVGVSAPHATVVDLAGVTDPVVAALPGGHTTKRLPPSFFRARKVDTLVLLLRRGAELSDPWSASSFDRGVEVWIASMPDADQAFEVAYESTSERLPYVVLRRRDEAEARAPPVRGGLGEAPPSRGFHWQAPPRAALSTHVAAGRGPHPVLRPRRDPRARRGGRSSQRRGGAGARAPARSARARPVAAGAGRRLAARPGVVGRRRR